MRILVLALAAVALAGCLSTKKPVFDETNSSLVGEVPEFMAYVETWEAFAGPGDGSPRELIEEGARGIVVDGIVVVQEHTDYYALVSGGARPLMCVIFADQNIAATAARHGVTVEVHKPEDASIDDQPVPVTADGPDAALVAFIRDQFANQRLSCIANPRRPG